MANIYIPDNTKKLLDKVSDTDNRSNAGELKHLLEKRNEEQELEGKSK